MVNWLQVASNLVALVCHTFASLYDITQKSSAKCEVEQGIVAELKVWILELQAKFSLGQQEYESLIAQCQWWTSPTVLAVGFTLPFLCGAVAGWKLRGRRLKPTSSRAVEADPVISLTPFEKSRPVKKAIAPCP